MPHLPALWLSLTMLLGAAACDEGGPRDSTSLAQNDGGDPDGLLDTHQDRDSERVNDAGLDAANRTELVVACQSACEISVQLSCQRTPSFEMCLSECEMGGSRCPVESTDLLRCLSALTVSDLECSGFFQTPVLRAGWCALETSALRQCELLHR